MPVRLNPEHSGQVCDWLAYHYSAAGGQARVSDAAHRDTPAQPVLLQELACLRPGVLPVPLGDVCLHQAVQPHGLLILDRGEPVAILVIDAHAVAHVLDGLRGAGGQEVRAGPDHQVLRRLAALRDHQLVPLKPGHILLPCPLGGQGVEGGHDAPERNC